MAAAAALDGLQHPPLYVQQAQQPQLRGQTKRSKKNSLRHLIFRVGDRSAAAGTGSRGAAAAGG